VTPYVPPKDEPDTELFTPKDFTENRAAGTVTCPAGQTSHYRKHGSSEHRTESRFQKATCAACPLLGRCMKNPPTENSQFGRTVSKNDHEAEYDRARQRAKTPEYASVRSEHATRRRLTESRKCQKLLWTCLGDPRDDQ
jgi:hypothetical protein